MNIKMFKSAMAGLALSVSGFANAGLIFDNGTINDTSSNGTCSSGPVSCGGDWVIFDDFTLSDSATLTSIEYTDFIHSGSTSDYLSTNWSIWENNPSLGGSALFSGNDIATLVQTSMTGSPYTFTVDNLSLNLTAGTYWLSTNNVVNNDIITTYAHTSSGNVMQYNGSTLHSTNKADRAFRLFGSSTSIPEPSTLVIFALGIMGLASRRFKQK